MSVVAFLTGIGGYIYGQYDAAKAGDSGGSQQSRGNQPKVPGVGAVKAEEGEDE
jgi:hypothetical protein